MNTINSSKLQIDAGAGLITPVIPSAQPSHRSNFTLEAKAIGSDPLAQSKKLTQSHLKTSDAAKGSQSNRQMQQLQDEVGEMKKLMAQLKKGSAISEIFNKHDDRRNEEHIKVNNTSPDEYLKNADNQML